MMPDEQCNSSKEIDTLIIVGNGFDIWQGLDTSYDRFRKYYLSHRDEILKQLNLKPYKTKSGEYITDVEMVYGNPFNPNALSDEFWWSFEASLDKVNSERINAYFGKTNEELYRLQTSVENAQAILREAFSNWIQSIEIAKKDSGYRFPDNCYCINFNYTDTVEKRFGTSQVCHIHGAQEDGEDIVFGHASHPQRPVSEFAQFGGRFMGLYLIENLLYETDKNVHSNIQFLRIDLASDGVKLDRIKNIFVLGHSFGPADVGYFQYLMDETSIRGTHNRREKRTEPIMTLDELQLRMQYAIHRYGENRPVSEEEAAAVQRRLEFENVFDEEDILGDFYSILPELKRLGCCTTDADWHISYHSPADKARIERVMQGIGCRKYKLYGTIDECIDEFKKQDVDSLFR